MKLTDEVLKLDCTKGSYVFAVTCETGVTLIDTGFPGRGEAILAELHENGIEPVDVKRILLTHHDVDHIGNAEFLQKMTGCEIFISATDYPYVMEGKKREGLKSVVGAITKPHKPAAVNRIEGGSVGEFAAIPSPGHTRGHMVYRFRDVMFLGDLVRGKDGGLALSPPIMTWDKAALIASIKALPVDGAQWLCVAHGEPVTASAWDVLLKNTLLGKSP